MIHQLSRRRFLQTSAACAAAAVANARDADGTLRSAGYLAVNDDGYVFLIANDDLHKADLRRYLESYCRKGVDAVAYCVGDMSWATHYPTRVGVHYSVMDPRGDLKRARIYRNVDNFASEPGGYFGSVFEILHDLGKKALASFRMNDAHFTSLDNPNVSEFWKRNAEFALGSTYGYYGGCLNYAADEVRNHFFDRVIEFVELYPEIDGIDLDAMRSPFFFPPGEGPQYAPLFTDLVQRIKTALAEQVRRLNRPDYLLTINVPLTPELALECGLDMAAWDDRRLFDWVAVGTYQAYMGIPIEEWKKRLRFGTPIYAYVNCSAQDGQYLGLEEYRAAASNAYGSGADGIYVFNYPCLFELVTQIPGPVESVDMTLPDMRPYGHPDLSRVGQALEELGRPESLRGKNKRFLFHFNKDARYRHYAPCLSGIKRNGESPSLKAPFRCYEEYGRARSITLRFKIENVIRGERFQASLNGQPIEPTQQRVRYAANGRDTRTHSVTLGPYQEFEISLEPGQLRKGENMLEITPVLFDQKLTTTINLAEVELIITYKEA